MARTRTKVPCKAPYGMLWPVSWTMGYSSIVYVILALEGILGLGKSDVIVSVPCIRFEAH